MTYIEKPKYYTTNRVFILVRRTPKYVVGTMLDLDTWKRNSTNILLSEFRKRFEVCPLQMK